MAQWQQIQMLERVYLDQVHDLYANDCLPMEVRQYLSYWIEEQNWSQAAQSDSLQACCLFCEMLNLLDDEMGRLVLGEENNCNIVLKHNLRRSKFTLKERYEDCPSVLAGVIDNLLRNEKAILLEAFANSQRIVELPPDASVATSPQHNVEERLAEIRKTVQGLKCSIGQLEELQDTFDFRFKTFKTLESAVPSDSSLPQKKQELQDMINKLDCCRKDILARIQELLGRSDTLRDLLLEELTAWQERQRKACIGATCDTNLGQLEKWFTGNAEDLFHLLQLLETLQRLRQGLSYERDSFALQLPQLERRLQEQIFCLLRSAFVVEIQPTMPFPNHRPLVLRTTNKFSVRARLLVKLLDRNHPIAVKMEIDRDSANLTGFRRFNILPSNTKTLEMDRPQIEGLVCDFRHITLREQKACGSGKGKGSKGANEGIFSVTEELHIISFTLDYCYQGLTCQLQTSTLPVVIISNVNQMSSAWPSILWFLMLSSDPKNQLFFSNPPAATWSQLSSLLSCQFSAVTERGLNADQLKMLREKLCGLNSTSQSTITWAMFSKDTDSGFSFWTWLDGILGLIQEHLLQLWNKGLIMGFVSRKRERSLLKKKRTGTFLLRFSESTQNGGITCTWVEYDNDGTPKFRSVEPYTKNELKVLALPDIIHDYQLVAAEDIPENPLQYLYPDTPRDEAFGPFYSERREGDLLEHKKYLNRRLIRVSARQPGESQTLEVNSIHHVENMLLPADVLPVEPVPLSNGTLPVEGVPLPEDVYHVAVDELLPSGIVPEHTELLHALQGLMFEKQDPFLPPPGEEQQQLPQELFEPPYEFPELSVTEDDFQI
ncbi:signal transducer and activator of transcription 2 isoform X2 [Tiliqua scincoides]|uniref:signal transducer and activator of transcription 2 isoform X2 n=1 Tax=Tiliqua scincoides TaxID=71010 RepID=UPI003462C4CF